MNQFSEFKKYVLRNLQSALEKAHKSQCSNLSQAISKVYLSKDIPELLNSLDEEYHAAPFEKSLIKGWPNQKYSLGWILRESQCFLIGVNDGDFAGYPIEEPFDSEGEENDREKDLFYN